MPLCCVLRMSNLPSKRHVNWSICRRSLIKGIARRKEAMRIKTGIIVICLLCLPVGSWATDSFWTAYFEAENFTAQTGGNKASTEYFPYIGEGYLEMGGHGATVTWKNITVPKAGKYTLLFKYANNTEQDRSCDLKVNGVQVKNMAFGPFTKNWETHRRGVSNDYSEENYGWAKYWMARVIVDLQAGANTVELTATSAQGGPHIDNIGVSTAIAEPPAPIVNITDHGAVGDGQTDNSQAIADAIEACPAGGSVVFEPGIYMTGSVTLKANITIWISEGATIRAFQDNSKFKNFSGGFFRRYFVFGNEVDNLTITGGGAIDGNSVGTLWNSVRERNRPTLFGFANSENVTVTNIDILNSGFWTFVPQTTDGLIVDGINLLSIHGYNKDGIDPIDVHNAYITNSTVTCTDDAICPKSYDRNVGIDNLVVKNITVNSTQWKGFKFGSATHGDFTESLFEDLAFVYCHSGLALLSVDGSNVKNLRFNRIKMSNVQTPIYFLNGTGLRTGRIGSTVEDIYVSNIEVRDVYGEQGSSIQGADVDGTVYPIKNIHLTNVDVQDFKGGVNSVPNDPQEMPRGKYPEVTVFGTYPAWGYYIRHAENVVFTNVTHSVSPEDVREDVVLEDVTGFENKGQDKPLPSGAKEKETR